MNEPEADRPRCECHGQPQHKRGRLADGSQAWRCSVAAGDQAATYRAKLAAEGLCARGDGRPVRPNYVECPECIEHRQTDPARIRQLYDARTRRATRERVERIAAGEAELAAIRERIREAASR